MFVDVAVVCVVVKEGAIAEGTIPLGKTTAFGRKVLGLVQNVPSGRSG